ncbi:hypothetical protein [Halovulum sp. GXIMD14793]
MTELLATTRAFAAEHVIWFIAGIVAVVFLTIWWLGTTKVERERAIRGGHYKGKITPKWLTIFQKEQSKRDAMAEEARRKLGKDPENL